MESGKREGLHVAIIMDGNGRWAARQGFPRVTGHRAGVAAVRRVVERAPELGISRSLPYRFHYVPQASFVNAFALPGGHVFVGEGFLKLMKSEDAVAAVLGHEVEHIDLRHCAERVQTEGHLRDLGSLGALLSLPVGVFTTGYSKAQELEADRYGTALAVASNYSPAGILQLLDEFDRLERKGVKDAGSSTSPVNEAAKVSVQTIEDYFRSHPPAAERKQQIEILARSQHWSTPPLQPLVLR